MDHKHPLSPSSCQVLLRSHLEKQQALAVKQRHSLGHLVVSLLSGNKDCITQSKLTLCFVCDTSGCTIVCGILAFIVAEAIPFFGLLLGLIGALVSFEDSGYCACCYHMLTCNVFSL